VFKHKGKLGSYSNTQLHTLHTY